MQGQSVGDRERTEGDGGELTPGKRPKRGVPEGLWLKCPGCGASIYRKDIDRRMGLCPECDHHFYVSASERIQQVLDEGTFEEWDAGLWPTDPLEFKDKRPYKDRLVSEQKRTGLQDAVITGSGMIRARRVAFAVTDSAFIMGSMGSVVGERLTRLAERATVEKLPLIIVSGSGGRGTNARRNLVADADGKGFSCAGTPSRIWRSFHFRSHKSNHGRRGCKLCLTR